MKKYQSFAAICVAAGCVLAGALLNPRVTTSHAAGRSAGADEKSDKPKQKELPLKAERQVEFTTDEGTWLTVDVSPDGKTIAFDMVGNIYTMPIEGGTATRITNAGMSFNRHPRYSPDGKWLAFVSDRDGGDNLYISKPDGSEPKQLTHDSIGAYITPSWTPDSQYVLVSRGGNSESDFYELWMYNILGGSGLQLTHVGGAESFFGGAVDPVASSDGKYFYYNKTSGGFGIGSWQIFRHNRATGEDAAITNQKGSAMRPEISPDCTKLIYASRHDAQTGLRVRELSSGDERWLKFPVQRDDQESGVSDLYPGYSFTPDGQSIVVFYGGKIHRINVANGDDRVIPFSVKVSMGLGPNLNLALRVDDSPSVQARLIQGAAESPDGRQVAFSSLGHLYVADLPGGTPHRLTKATEHEFFPAWSPDGQWIAYATWSDEKGGQLWKVRGNGDGAQQLTQHPAYYFDPVWSPDGERVVAVRGTFEGMLESGQFNLPFALARQPYDLIWLSAQGGDSHLIAAAHGVRPHFGAEKDRIYLTSGRELVSLRWDGTERRTIAKYVGASPMDRADPFTISGIMLNPDGKSALALYRTQLYLIAIPQVGGDPVSITMEAGGVPVKRLTSIGADFFGWGNGGKSVTWSVGSHFFREQLSSISFEPEKKAEGDAKPDENKTAANLESHAEEIPITIEEPRQRTKGTVVLRGAKVITMKGDEVIPDADIVVTDNRIAGVGKKGTVSIPAGATTIDVKGETIMPGIIDTHDHWMEAERVVLDNQSWPFLADLAYGVTTGRDPQTSTPEILAYQDLIAAGEMLGPRAYSTGPGIFRPEFKSAEEVEAMVSKYSKYYRTHMIKAYLSGNREQRQWILQACKKLGVMPTNEGAGDLALDLTHAIDGFSGNEHGLPIVPIYKDVVEIFAKSEITDTPTLIVAYGGPRGESPFFENSGGHDDSKLRRFVPHFVLDEKFRHGEWNIKDEYHYPQMAAGAAKIVAAGGRIGVGGHGELAGLGTHWELWMLQSGGMGTLEALRCATLHGAQAIGFEKDLGSIEVGKMADLIVLNKDPLADIHNTTSIRYVMRNGQMFEGDTLNQVWPEKKPLPAQWFWNDELSKK
jgi:Tol biopolymer transport system component